jgi:hypothetical protein
MLKLIQEVAIDGDDAYDELAIGFCEAAEVGFANSRLESSHMIRNIEMHIGSVQ